MSDPAIASSTETGILNVMHLKRYWCKCLLKRAGKLKQDAFFSEWSTDTTLLKVLGLGLEQTLTYVYQQAPAFDEFENWIVATAGAPNAEKTMRFNRLFTHANEIERTTGNCDQLLNADDWDFWSQNGYLIIRNAVSVQNCDAVIDALCKHIGIDRYDAATWYQHHQAQQGIMVQLFQHPSLEVNRHAYKIRKVYEELWQRTDLWVNTDRVSFNPPQAEQYKFQGPYLHWDVSLKLPIPFGLQGLLYLADTAENQGAFTLVPGFHNRIESWLNSLPPNADPRQEDLYALGPKPIAANAGDFIIWQQALPHGSSPNTATQPRFVQYIKYEPADNEESDTWI